MVKVVLDTNIFVSSIFWSEGNPHKIIECAISCGADYIVSGDKHLLNLKEHDRVKIVSAKRFIEIIR